jgi:hypothetical protein
MVIKSLFNILKYIIPRFLYNLNLWPLSFD